MAATMVASNRSSGRQFAELAANQTFIALRNHLNTLSGATLTRFANASDYESAYMTFRYRDHQFRVDERYGKLQFSVASASCPERTAL